MAKPVGYQPELHGVKGKVTYKDGTPIEGVVVVVLDREQKLLEENQANLAKILTPRELEIANLVAQDRSNKQIAKQLKISKWTVSTHLRRIFIKLQVDNRAAMVYSCFGIVQNLYL